MKCDDFKENIWRLFDSGDCPEMHRHMDECRECRDYYESVRGVAERLTPAVRPTVPASLADDVLREVGATRAPRRSGIRRRLSRIAAAAVAVVLVAGATLLVVAPNPARAAGNIFAGSMGQMGNVRTMVMKLKIRTLPQEIFSYIDLDASMEPYTLTVELGGPKRWRLDKPGRTAQFDGDTYYSMIHDLKQGFYSKRQGFIDDFTVFLDPYALLSREKQLADLDSGAKYKVTERGDVIYLTVEAKAQGDFENDYLLNSSIEESDNIREYVFDASTRLLKGLKAYVLNDGERVLVLEVETIAYDTPVDDTTFSTLPDGYVWKDVDYIPDNDRFKDITAEQAARMVLEAILSGRTSTLTGVLDYYDTDRLVADYSGARIGSVGEAFRSGTYAGVFVPCELILPNGSTEVVTMALRNDNPNRMWLVDGGI